MCAAPELSGRVVTGDRTQGEALERDASQQPYTLVTGSRPQQESTEVDQRDKDDVRDMRTSERVTVSNLMMRMRAAERVDMAIHEKKKSKTEERKEKKKRAEIEKEKYKRKEARMIREWRVIPEIDDDEDNDEKKNGNLVETPRENYGKPVGTPGNMVMSGSMSAGMVRDDERKDDVDRMKHTQSDEKDEPDVCVNLKTWMNL